ncbi:MAG: ABC transporter substrate-binding protein [Hamadaea sp.]|uniref:ABC transporter substrate-binding protein n=1 Tax=Hamadaea sp. TaxID=2024425 RepID=UPI00185B36F5|nr:ABC transporter substrate-binding protein [Hamadaea sp.]NUR71965.1 ABC transporter substrate-binding protein [Hamadaea sp.]NUT23856.1 ABC transporter substrate-binding protein [Hamadaea sp.]
MHRHVTAPSWRRRAAYGVTAALALSAVAACDSAASTEADAPAKGGTLTVFVGALPDHLDPQIINAALEVNISRLVTRTLTTTKAEPGDAASEIVPDLATDTGRPSDGNKTWEFKLRDGVKWQDGTPITCKDLKYGAERNFSELMQEGLPYVRNYLDAPKDYKGPFLNGNNSGQGIKAVECVDEKTVQYHLKQAVGDFGYVAALTGLAPVRQDIEGKNRSAYDEQPFSSGPYKIADGRTDTTMTLVRNDNWDAGIDSVRKAYPDKIVVQAASDSAEETNKLIADQGPEHSGIMIDLDVAPNFLQQVVNDPDLAARTATGTTGAVRFFAINTRKITDMKCRQALSYAFDKRKFRTALGGSISGELATSFIPPSLAAHKDFDVYGTNTHPDGDIERAAELLKQAKNCPPGGKLRVAYRDSPTNKRLMKPVVEMYLKVGIQVEAVPVTYKTYYHDVSDSSMNFDLILAGWVPDYPNGSAVLPALFDGRNLPAPGEFGTNNYSFFNDDEINRLMDEAVAEPDLERQYKLWGELDQKIMEKAAAIPVVYAVAQRIYGSNVTNVFISPMFAQPDLSAIALKDPSKSGAAG